MGGSSLGRGMMTVLIRPALVIPIGVPDGGIES